MSHFYGTVTGQAKTKATRRGAKSSGLTTVAASWGGAVSVRIWHDEETGEDRYAVSQVPWHGVGVNAPIAEGVIGRD